MCSNSIKSITDVWKKACACIVFICILNYSHHLEWHIPCIIVFVLCSYFNDFTPTCNVDVWPTCILVGITIVDNNTLLVAKHIQMSEYLSLLVCVDTAFGSRDNYWYHFNDQDVQQCTDANIVVRNMIDSCIICVLKLNLCFWMYILKNTRGGSENHTSEQLKIIAIHCVFLVS